jgi:hypothetical protein
VSDAIVGVLDLCVCVRVCVCVCVFVCARRSGRAVEVCGAASDPREGFNNYLFHGFFTLTALTVDLPLTVDRKKMGHSKALELCLAGFSD